MEFTDLERDAQAWETLPGAAKALDASFSFGPAHKLTFSRLRSRWIVSVEAEGERLGFVARFIVRNGAAVFL